MNVLVVRPEPECSALVSMLQQQKINAIGAPFLTFSKGRDWLILADKVAKLPADSIVIAVSLRAIDFSTAALKAARQDWRHDLRYFTVGAPSAAYWQQLANVAVQYPSARHDSEGLLELMAAENINGTKVVILRGNGGRALLGDALKQQGAALDYVESYQRHWDANHVLSQAATWQAERIDTLVVTSGEQLELLASSMPIADHNWFYRALLVVPSKRIQNQAIALGFNNIICVENPSNQVVFGAVNKINNSGLSNGKQE